MQDEDLVDLPSGNAMTVPELLQCSSINVDAVVLRTAIVALMDVLPGCSAEHQLEINIKILINHAMDV